MTTNRNEAYEQQMRDSDMIFTQISTADCDDMHMANQMLCAFYIPDMTISRAGISHAIKRLEQFFAEKKTA